MQRLRGIVIGQDPQWRGRMLLNGEDGCRYVVRSDQLQWPGQSPCQCLTPGSAVTFVGHSSAAPGQDRIGDLRLPELHPDWPRLQAMHRSMCWPRPEHWPPERAPEQAVRTAKAD